MAPKGAIPFLWREQCSRDRLERDSFTSNRHRALVYCLSMIFFGKPVSTFPDHALIPRGRESRADAAQIFRQACNLAPIFVVEPDAERVEIGFLAFAARRLRD